MIDFPTGRDYFTPDEMEAAKATSKALTDRMLPIIRERRELALKYLDDGSWTHQSAWVWARTTPDGDPCYYDVDRDRLHIGSWGTKKRVTHLSNAFVELFMWFHEIKDGIGPNRLPERRRKPRKNAISQHEKAYVELKVLEDNFLPPLARRWNQNIPPPREVLEQIVRWDKYLGALYYYNEDRDIIEYVLDHNFVVINSEVYAIWRVRSVLEYGNPDGVIDLLINREKLDEFQPIELPPPDVTSKPKKNFRYNMNGIKRLKPGTSEQTKLKEEYERLMKEARAQRLARSKPVFTRRSLKDITNE